MSFSGKSQGCFLLISIIKSYSHQSQSGDVHQLIDTMDYWIFHHAMIHYPIQSDDPLKR